MPEAVLEEPVMRRDMVLDQPCRNYMASGHRMANLQAVDCNRRNRSSRFRLRHHPHLRLRPQTYQNNEQLVDLRLQIVFGGGLSKAVVRQEQDACL